MGFVGSLGALFWTTALVPIANGGGKIAPNHVWPNDIAGKHSQGIRLGTLHPRAVRREPNLTQRCATENLVGSDVCQSIVLESTQGLMFTHAHKDRCTSLANQLFAVNINLTYFLGRCGVWELIDRKRMMAQLYEESQGNFLTFTKHKTMKVFSRNGCSVVF